MIEVSPLHRIELADEYLEIVKTPPREDFLLRQLSRKEVNGQPLIAGDLVIAGIETREAYPLAVKYPVHFRKTYYPIAFHQDPGREQASHEAASEVLRLPPAIGSTRTSFRSCFIPGRPFDTMSPFGLQPEERNFQVARETESALLIGLWKILEAVYDQVVSLHSAGIAHGDLLLHNVIVAMQPPEPFLIDFEKAVHREDAKEERWSRACLEDTEDIFRNAIWLQCGMGRQPGRLGRDSLEAIGRVCDDPDRTLREVMD